MKKTELTFILNEIDKISEVKKYSEAKKIIKKSLNYLIKRMKKYRTFLIFLYFGSFIEKLHYKFSCEIFKINLQEKINEKFQEKKYDFIFKKIDENFKINYILNNIKSNNLFRFSKDKYLYRKLEIPKEYQKIIDKFLKNYPDEFKNYILNSFYEAYINNTYFENYEKLVLYLNDFFEIFEDIEEIRNNYEFLADYYFIKNVKNFSNSDEAIKFLTIHLLKENELIQTLFYSLLIEKTNFTFFIEKFEYKIKKAFTSKEKNNLKKNTEIKKSLLNAQNEIKKIIESLDDFENERTREWLKKNKQKLSKLIEKQLKCFNEDFQKIFSELKLKNLKG